MEKAALAGFGLSLAPQVLSFASARPRDEKRVGIIGLDTSHSLAFTKAFNATDAASDLGGYKVVAAYPHGSKDIPSSVERIPGYTEEIQTLGVEIVDSISSLLEKVNVVLLETNDGRLHLEQALEVFKSGKTVFIDKPISASLVDAIAIFEAAKKYNVPVFSSSSLRYMENAVAVRNGKIGKVMGADTFSPATLEPTHPDLFWYGIHGVETLYTLMGTGCETVQRTHTEGADVVVGTWGGGRIGTFRGTRSGKSGYGGRAFGEEGILDMGSYGGYRPLLVEIAKFFDSGKAPVSAEETIEIFAFMQAADESKKINGHAVSLQAVLDKGRREAAQISI
ncbi:Gfo/Idh/MocA family oxidoreductase [Cyclobacterium jeungdonense]|uniref:Gfo/Idh/MocA family oxidoreductase n=2 Tax=Cyclobacterium jeungdonense TaxID=708087 RepID=A0ABT8C1L7_9BACT|nr:Gfo/Idh/MocA family oxidoreductase [Cyclobacterium jeungdonense]